MEITGTADKTSDKIWSKAFINIFIVNIVMSMGQYMMTTLIPLYAYQLGSAANVVGMVTGIFAVTALGVRPIAGPAMDYFKKTRLLSLSIGLIALTFVLYGLAHSIAFLVVARLTHGIAMGFMAPLSLAIVSNILPSGKMASGLGIFSLGSAVATAIGPQIGLKLVAATSYNTTFFICSGLMFTCFLLSLTLKGEEPKREERFKISLKRIIAPEVIMPTLVLLFEILAFSSINAFIAIFGGLNGVKEIGYYFTASAVCMIVIRPFSGRVADKYGLDKTIIPGFIVFMGGLILISFSRTLPMFMLAGVVTSLGFGVSEPIIQTMNMQLVPKERRGAAGNTNFMGIDVGFLLGPTIAGSLVTSVQKLTGNELMGYSVMYRIMVLPAVIGLIIFAVNRKKILGKMRAVQESSEKLSEKS